MGTERERILKVKSESEVAQSSPPLCDPMDCSPPASSIHRIFQARILEWVPFPSPGDLLDLLQSYCWLLTKINSMPVSVYPDLYILQKCTTSPNFLEHSPNMIVKY